MICSSCHNPQRLGALSWPMDRILIHSYVTGGQMPFGRQLAFADRRDLYTKLVQEYFATDQDNPGILKSWLIGSSREGFAFLPNEDAPRGAPGNSQQR